MLTMPCTTVVSIRVSPLNFCTATIHGIYQKQDYFVESLSLICSRPTGISATENQAYALWVVFFLVVERIGDDNVCSPEFPGVATKQFSMSCLACGVKSPVKKRCVFVCVCVCAFTIFWRKLIIDVNLYTLLESTPKPVQASEYLQL